MFKFKGEFAVWICAGRGVIHLRADNCVHTIATRDACVRDELHEVGRDDMFLLGNSQVRQLIRGFALQGGKVCVVPILALLDVLADRWGTVIALASVCCFALLSAAY